MIIDIRTALFYYYINITGKAKNHYFIKDGKIDTKIINNVVYQYLNLNKPEIFNFILNESTTPSVLQKYYGRKLVYHFQYPTRDEIILTKIYEINKSVETILFEGKHQLNQDL